MKTCEHPAYVRFLYYDLLMIIHLYTNDCDYLCFFLPVIFVLKSKIGLCQRNDLFQSKGEAAVLCDCDCEIKGQAAICSVRANGRPLCPVRASGRPLCPVRASGRPLCSVRASGRPLCSVRASGRPLCSVRASGRPCAL
jgi:hypothetical protein